MDYEAAGRYLRETASRIEAWGSQYHAYYSKPSSGAAAPDRPAGDDVLQRVRVCRDLTAALGEPLLAIRMEARAGLHYEHPFEDARDAIVEAEGVINNRATVAEIIGPIGPQLAAAQMAPLIWSSASTLWDGGHYAAAVRTASTALEGHLQHSAGRGESGAKLAGLFSLKPPAAGAPRLRFRDLRDEEGSETWISVHEGTAALIRGTFQAIRNVVSHPGWPEPDAPEALEMLAVMSYIARLVDRCELEEASGKSPAPALTQPGEPG